MWNRRFLQLAELISTWSKDPSTKVGCVIVDEDRNILATGYNGFPRGVSDDDRLQDRAQKIKIIVHAEANAVAAAARNSPSLKNSTIYITRHPCGQCAALLIQAGIKNVVCSSVALGEKWKEDAEFAKRILYEAGVSLILV